MSRRTRLVEGENYLWDGERTLVVLTEEAHTALQSAMTDHAWPFLEELAGWDSKDPDSNIIHFTSNANPFEELRPEDGAIKTLQRYMPIQG